MPRIARRLSDGDVYHVLNRGNGGQRVFHDLSDYRSFVDLMREGKSLYSVRIFAYCLMPEHFHLLLLPERGEELSRFMQWLTTSHVRRYHWRYGSNGHVWQGRFKSTMIQNNEHLLKIANFVEGNAVRRGLVRSAADWAWTSHHENSGRKLPVFIDKMPVASQANRKDYGTVGLTDGDHEMIRQSIIRQSPYGDREWQEQVCSQLGLTLEPRRRGRPRK